MGLHFLLLTYRERNYLKRWQQPELSRGEVQKYSPALSAEENPRRAKPTPTLLLWSHQPTNQGIWRGTTCALQYGLEKAPEHIPYLGAEKAMSTPVSNSFLFTGCIHRSLRITGKGLQKHQTISKTNKQPLLFHSTPKGRGKAAPAQCKVLWRRARPHV